MSGPSLKPLWMAYRLRWKRRRLLWRAFRSRRSLVPLADRSAKIRRDTILAVSVMRNEVVRLPHFLSHYRKLGIGHFLIVDNGSTDGTAAYLADQPDVSVWRSDAGYKAARFGMDWLTWMQCLHAHGHWCLTVDADELLIYPHWDNRDLHALTDWLDRSGQEAFPAMMLDLYPKGPLAEQSYRAGEDPTAVLRWFDGGNYTLRRQAPLGTLWIQGGPRARVFFADEPRKAPTLTKVPLVKWRRRYAYVNSTHSLLPPRLNHVYGRTGGEMGSGLLLHTKFLPIVVERSQEERLRREHFARSEEYEGYYARLTDGPDLWTPSSTRLGGWRQLEAMGLMSRGGWT